MNSIIEEELERVCFQCGFDKLKSEENITVLSAKNKNDRQLLKIR